MSKRRAAVRSRTRARRQALQILYQSEISGIPVPRILEERTYSTVEVEPAGKEGEEVLIDDVPLEDYATTLVLGCDRHCEQLDQMLSSASQNWRLWRMPTVDRNILRLGTYEILYGEEVDVPAAVAINEAVELAHSFAGDESTKFINGVLGNIAARCEADKKGNPPIFDVSALPHVKLSSQSPAEPAAQMDPEPVVDAPGFPAAADAEVKDDGKGPFVIAGSPSFDVAASMAPTCSLESDRDVRG